MGDGKKVLTHREMIAAIGKSGRDNARSPMQWDATENAGFSTGTPWITVNPNYRTVNAAARIGDPDSVWNYYRRLIRLRKEHPVMVYGNYKLLFPEDEKLFVYRRNFETQSLLVICNFSPDTVRYSAGEKADWGELLTANYPGERDREASPPGKRGSTFPGVHKADNPLRL
jgi:glycosidase